MVFMAMARRRRILEETPSHTAYTTSRYTPEGTPSNLRYTVQNMRHPCTLLSVPLGYTPEGTLLISGKHFRGVTLTYCLNYI
jgi:hypothetical protein